MILKTGDMWKESEADAILFTANSTIRADGALVMGRGAALECQSLYAGCNKQFGQIIKGRRLYGVVLGPNDLKPGYFLGAFQVKYHFKDNADIGLISYSTGKLFELAKYVIPDLLWAVNFPGIGWGRLKREDVLPIISILPDNVEVWEK